VYMAEERIGAGQSWHVGWFNCASCHTRLDSSTLAENKGEIYCRACHTKEFGPKGYGYGGGAGVLTITSGASSSSGGSSGQGAFCAKCGEGDQRGKFCSQCGEAVQREQSSSQSSPAATPAVNATAARRAFEPAKTTQTLGGSNQCPACGKPVYAAEKVIGAGKDWHKLCFRCAACGKGLDSTTVVDRDGQIFCRACYGKNFGPKGYGYGQGAGALVNTQ